MYHFPFLEYDENKILYKVLIILYKQYKYKFILLLI